MSQNSLLTAAIAGLMGVALSSCGKEEKEKIVNVPISKGTVTSTVQKSYTLSEFQALCLERGGLVEFHASCGGVNTCKGVSYSYGKIKEHTCRAANTCAGMSCVDLATDQGRQGKDLVKDDGAAMGESNACTSCHTISDTEFNLPISPSTNEATAKAAFAAKPDSAVVASIAFGIHGIRTDGTHFANMPAYYTSFSRKEIESIVAHIRTLTITTKAWTDPQ